MIEDDNGGFCETWLIRGYIRRVAYYWTEHNEWTKDIDEAVLHTPFRDSDMMLWRDKLLASIPKDKRIRHMSVIPGPEMMWEIEEVKDTYN